MYRNAQVRHVKVTQKTKGEKRIGTPMEVRVAFCQLSCALSIISFKRAIPRLTQVAGTVEWGSWLVLFLGDTWALGKLPLEEEQKRKTLPFQVCALSVACAC